MTQVGNMVIGEHAELLRVDAGFSDIMRAPVAALLGRNVLDLTFPADRSACLAAMEELRATRRPFRMDKRLLRPDGSTVWVSKTVSSADFGQGDPTILGTIVTIDAPAPADRPALVTEAMRQAAQLSLRASTFGAPLFGQPAWAMLLAAYILADQGGTPLTGIARAACAVPSQSLRWVRALAAEGLLAEDRMGAVPLYSLSESGTAMLECYLTRALKG